MSSSTRYLITYAHVIYPTTWTRDNQPHTRCGVLKPAADYELVIFMVVWLITHPVGMARSTIYSSWIFNYATARGLEWPAGFSRAARKVHPAQQVST